MKQKTKGRPQARIHPLDKGFVLEEMDALQDRRLDEHGDGRRPTEHDTIAAIFEELRDLRRSGERCSCELDAELEPWRGDEVTSQRQPTVRMTPRDKVFLDKQIRAVGNAHLAKEGVLDYPSQANMLGRLFHELVQLRLKRRLCSCGADWIGAGKRDPLGVRLV